MQGPSRLAFRLLETKEKISVHRVCYATA